MAGGVVLGAAFSHLMSDSQEFFEKYMEMVDPPKEGEDHEYYPFAFLIAAFSLMLLISIDRLALKDHNHGNAHLSRKSRT